MNLVDIYRTVSTSKILEKLGSSKNAELQKTALEAKVLIDIELFEYIKTADLHPAISKLLKGALFTAGAAVPIGVAGYALMDKASDTGSILQNKVLQTALALAGVGAGLYGLHRLSREPEKAASVEDDNELFQEAVEKFAAIAYLDDLLEKVANNDVSADAKKLAVEIRILNRGYGVHLLHEMAGG